MDDLMAGKPDHDGLYVVVNAGNKDADFAFLKANLQGDATLTFPLLVAGALRHDITIP